MVQENKMWIGVTPMGTDMLFDVPKSYADELVATKSEGSSYKIVDGVVKGRTQSVWFTNLDFQKRHENFFLYKKYNKLEYSKYDNYDAINIDRVSDIPVDYDGVMGVPISFMDKYNPDQFEIIDGIGRYSFLHGATEKTKGKYLTKINNNPIYARIIIKHKRIKK